MIPANALVMLVFVRRWSSDNGVEMIAGRSGEIRRFDQQQGFQAGYGFGYLE